MARPEVKDASVSTNYTVGHVGVTEEMKPKLKQDLLALPGVQDVAFTFYNPDEYSVVLGLDSGMSRAEQNEVFWKAVVILPLLPNRQAA